tara:strand:+ start:489 stop:848 length:360 start_codon:yes stop_codon:yes gene_type:complete
MKNILITLVTLIGFVLPQDCEEPIDTWFKISNYQDNYGKLLTLDMTSGFAFTDGMFIYLIVYEKDTKEEIVISFPIGHWEVEKIIKKNPKKDEKKEFDLDEYLKQNRGKGIKITNKVGD